MFSFLNINVPSTVLTLATWKAYTWLFVPFNGLLLKRLYRGFLKPGGKPGRGDRVSVFDTMTKLSPLTIQIATIIYDMEKLQAALLEDRSAARLPIMRQQIGQLSSRLSQL